MQGNSSSRELDWWKWGNVIIAAETSLLCYNICNHLGTSFLLNAGEGPTWTRMLTSKLCACKAIRPFPLCSETLLVCSQLQLPGRQVKSQMLCWENSFLQVLLHTQWNKILRKTKNFRARLRRTKTSDGIHYSVTPMWRLL